MIIDQTIVDSPDHIIMTARIVKGLGDMYRLLIIVILAYSLQIWYKVFSYDTEFAVMILLLVCPRCYWVVEESAQGVIVTLVLRPVIPTAVMER